MDSRMESSWNLLLRQVELIRDQLGDPRQAVPYVEAFGELVKNHVFYDDDVPEGHLLVHYTSWQSALSILKDVCPVLRMYNYESANDPLEGTLSRSVWDRFEDDAKWVNEHLPEHEKTLLRFGRSAGTTYGCAFSSDKVGVEDNLTFWRFYGNDGEGCSFLLGGRPKERIYRVRYLDENRKNRSKSDEELDDQIATWLQKLIRSGKEITECAANSMQSDIAKEVASGARKILSGYRHLAKSSDFKDELEWRIIAVSPEPKSVLFDVDVDGVVKRYIQGPSLKDVMITDSAITIGPRVPNGGAAQEYVRRLLRFRDMASSVRLSKRSYRSDV